MTMLTSMRLPWVKRYTWSKILSCRMSWMVKTSTVTGQISGFVDFAGNIFQTRDEEQQAEAEAPPDRDQRDRGHEQRHRSEYREMLAAVQGGKEILRDAEVLVEHPAPDPVHDRNRKDIGQKKRGEHDALSPALEAADAKSDNKREQGAGGNGQDHE